MDVFTKIHTLTLGDHCFVNKVNLEEIQELVSFSENSEDETLLKLTILHRLFYKNLDKKSCMKLIDICENVIDNGVVRKLIVLMNSGCQHVVFMTSKTLTGILLFKPSLVKEFDVQKALSDCLDFKWKAVYIMKMLTQIVTSLCNGDMHSHKNAYEGRQQCACTRLMAGQCHLGNSNSSLPVNEMMHDGNEECAKSVASLSCDCVSSIPLMQLHHHGNNSSTMHVGKMMHNASLSSSLFGSPHYHGNLCFVKLIAGMLQNCEVVLSTYLSLWKDMFDEYRLQLCEKKFPCDNYVIQKYQEFHMIYGMKMHQKSNHGSTAIPKNVEHILLSFLQFLSRFLKWITHLSCQDNSCEDSILEIKSIRELLQSIPVFAYILKTEGLTSEVWKNIIELLFQCIKTGNYTKKCKHFQQFSISLSCHVVTAVMSSVTFSALDNIPLFSGFEGFGGQNIMVSQSTKVQLKNKPCCSILRQVSLLVMKASVVFMAEEDMNDLNGSIKVVHNVLNIWSSLLMGESPTSSSNRKMCRVVLDLFIDQDDEMVAMMLLTLKMYKSFVKTAPHCMSITCINPHIMFTEFLAVLHYDHTVLLDFLVSCETAFLEYMMGYLQLLVHDWEGFCQQLQDERMTTISKDVENENGNTILMIKDDNDVRMLQVLKDDDSDFNDEKMMMMTDERLSPSKDDLEDDCNDNMMLSVSKNSMMADNDEMMMTDDYGEQRGSYNNIDVGLGCLSGVMEAYGSSDDDGCSDGDDENDFDDGAGKDQNDVYDGVDGNDGIGSNGDDDDDDDDGGNDSNDDDGIIDGDDNTKLSNSISSKNNTQDLEDTSSSSILDKTMSTLIHLRISIQRLVGVALFPYNAGPLIKKLRTVETFYDGC